MDLSLFNVYSPTATRDPLEARSDVTLGGRRGNSRSTARYVETGAAIWEVMRRNTSVSLSSTA